MNKNDFLNDITMRISDKLSQGTLPWRKAWNTGSPANYTSKRVYNGINFLSLLLNEYPSSFYITFLQCKEKSGFINKGSTGSVIVYWNVNEKYIVDEDTNTLKSKRYPLIRFSYVFNLSQTSLYTEESQPVISTCESIIDNMPVKPVIKHNIRGCYYSPAEDYISLPVISDFQSKEEYYSALFHELIHWTGHPSRLNRASGKYGDKDYAYEELIAELGSAYLCSMCGLSNTTLDNHASYIDGWLKLMKTNSSLLLAVSHEAQTAVDSITNINLIQGGIK